MNDPTFNSWPETPRPYRSIADEDPPLPNLARFVPAHSFRAARIIFILLGFGYLIATVSLIGGRDHSVEAHRVKAEQKAKKDAGILWFFQRGRIQHEAETIGRVIDALSVGFAVVGVAFLLIALIIKRYPAGSMMVGVSLFLSLTAFGYYVILGQEETPEKISSLFVSLPINFLILVSLIKTLRMTIATRLANRAALAEAGDGLPRAAVPPSANGRLTIDRQFFISEDSGSEPDEEEALFVIAAEPEMPEISERITVELPSTGAKEIAWIEDSPERSLSEADAVLPDRPVPMELGFHIPPRRRLSDTCIVVALASVLTAVLLGSSGIGIAAILPGTLAIVMLSHRTAAVWGRLAREGIEIQKPKPELIWYANLFCIDADVADPDNPPESFTIRVTHRHGILTIPGAPGIESRMIYRVLLDQTAPRHRPFVDPALIAYAEKNRQVFGSDKLWTTATNPGLSFPRKNVGGSVAIACFVTSIVWMIVGGIDPSLRYWAGLGTLLMLLGVLIFLLNALARRRITRLNSIEDWRTSCLVISPLGLAMRQGKRIGKLRWDQISEVQFKPPRRPSHIHVRGRLERSIIIWAEGVPIEIIDLYCDSTSRIYARIMAYWQRDFRRGAAQPRLLSQ